MSFDAEVYAENQKQIIEQQRQEEFAKFTIKTTMTAQEIKAAVMEEEYEYVKENDDILFDYIVERHAKEKISDELYIEMYMDNVYTHDGDTLQNQLEEEATNGTNK